MTEHVNAKSFLLVWDAPNLDMGLGSILGGRPPSNYRPRFDALGTWLLHLAADQNANAEATVFTNVIPGPGAVESIRPWVEALRNIGYAVFAKPKLTEDSDVDPDMVAHIRSRHEQDRLAGVVVASADGRNFQELLDELAGEMPVYVIGFEEHSTWAMNDPAITFVDLEEIEGVFRSPLPRVSLDNLPEDGAWLVPLRPLTALLDQDRED